MRCRPRRGVVHKRLGARFAVRRLDRRRILPMMRRFSAVALASSVLLGCSEMDELRTRVQARFGPPQQSPVQAASASPSAAPVPACSFPWVRPAPREERTDLRIGAALFRGLARRQQAWWYERAEVVAYHLRRGDYPAFKKSDAHDFADEAVANGRDLFVADDVVVDVPASTVVTISVPSDESNVSLVPAGVSRFGGFVPADGVKSVRCVGGDSATSFHIGFIVAGPRCVPVTVESDGRRSMKRVRFGASRCS